MTRQTITTLDATDAERAIVLDVGGMQERPCALAGVAPEERAGVLGELHRRAVDEGRVVLGWSLRDIATVRAAIDDDDEMLWWERNLVNARILDLAPPVPDRPVPYPIPPELEAVRDEIEIDPTWLEIRADIPEPPGIERFWGAWADLDAFFAPYITDRGWAVTLVRNIDSAIGRRDECLRAVGKFRATCEACADLNWLIGRVPTGQWRPAWLHS